MPTLFVLNGWKIQMFVAERERPHFHVNAAGDIYRFALSDFQQLSTDIYPAPAGMARKVQLWAHRNRVGLDAAYESLKAGQVPDKSLFT